MLKAFAACIHYQVATPPEWPQATTAAKQTYNQALAVSELDVSLMVPAGSCCCFGKSNMPHTWPWGQLRFLPWGQGYTCHIRRLP